MPQYRSAKPAQEEAAEAHDGAEAASEIIEIHHGEDGTDITIQDPTLTEVGALLVIALGIVGALFVLRRYARRFDR